MLRCLEAIETAATSTTALRRIPIRKGNVEDADILMRLFPESYGLRGRDMKVHFLNPWEFVMFWDVLRLRPPPLDADGPKAERSLTEWVAKGTFGAIPTGDGERWYALKNDLRQVPDNYDYLPYPRDVDDEQLAAFRNQWIMKRHK